MAVNKVDVNGVTVLDLTQDSVTPATLKKGETAHDASGAAIVGEMESSAPSLQSKSVTITANGTNTITPDAGYDGLSSVDVTVDVSGGGSETQAGRSVTFPATATRWQNIVEAILILSDGTSVHFEDYSVVAGKTINNVIAIKASSTRSYDYFKITMLTGAIVQIRISDTTTVYMANAPGATSTFMGNSMYDVFIPIEDVTISAIEMYNTD